MKKGIITHTKENIENYLPMTLSSFAMFLIVIYFLFIVGKTTWANYVSNKSITTGEAKVAQMEDDLGFMRNQIAYYQTSSFKELEAREKLSYQAPGESVLSLPLDQPINEYNDTVLDPARVKIPNYRLWWEYLFGNSN